MKSYVNILILSALAILSCTKENDEPKQDFFVFPGEIGTHDNSSLISFDDNIVICGNVGFDACILKVSKSGELLWRKDLAIRNECMIYAIAEDRDHELFICGNVTPGNTSPWHDLLVIKTAMNGDTIWTKAYGGDFNDHGCQMITTQDNDLLICGFSDYDVAAGNMYALKINTDGDTLWTRTFPDPDPLTSYHLLETQNGEYLITGVFEDENFARNLYLLKISANGEKVWDKKIGPSTRWGYCTVELSNGDLLTCGKESYGQLMLVKTDPLGNVIWNKGFGVDSLSETGYSMKIDDEGSCMITGSSYNSRNTSEDIILFKVDQNGDLTWFRTFLTEDNNWGINLLQDKDMGYIITGNSHVKVDEDVYERNIVMVKVDKNGEYK